MSRMTFERYHPIDAGIYHFMIKDCQEKERQSDHEKFYSWSVEVLTEGDFLGKTVSLPTPLKFGPSSAAYRFLRASGMPELTDLSELDTDDFFGQEFYAEVTIEANKKTGQDGNKFKTFWTVVAFEEMLSKAAGTVKPQKAAATVRPQKAGEVKKADAGANVVKPNKPSSAAADKKEGALDFPS